MGRLSNPPEARDTISDQGRSGRRQISRAAEATPGAARTRKDVGPPKERGRLSNPVRRRLFQAEIEQLVHLYRDGASIGVLAVQYDVHRTTVTAHLERTGIARRRVTRKMTEESVGLAAVRYEAGASLAAVARAFGVHDRTLAREFRRAGVSIRPRRGWHP